MEKKAQEQISFEEKRRAAIAKRRADIPKKYRNTYDKAISGRSLRSAIKAHCLECVCWQRDEVRLCTSLACPLWAVRPYQEILPNAHNEAFGAVESTNDPVLVSG